ncbi:hypothetical protein [Rhizobium sp. Leaf341]|uniref:hypothetical protein n=1 Tax=Rhizobium sp. Leaf341 TaxID=1736344 RepID=UPI00071577AA|nr:hypothetical protein [Rhizobium sp. Leaf341]KQR77569.1 hypothetical protein ASG03_14260 [Rhizobium sp. Leaf341]
MSYNLAVPGPSVAGLPMPTLSASEAAALETPGLIERISARDPAYSETGLAYYGGVSGGLWRGRGGAFADKQSLGRPSVRFNAGGFAYVTGQLALPPSYTIYVLGRVNAAKSFNSLFSSLSQTDARAWMCMDAARTLRLIHGAGQVGTTATVADGASFVAMASFDLATLTGAVSLNSLGGLVTGALPIQKGSPVSSIGGIQSTDNDTTALHTLNGWIEEVWIYSGSHGLDGADDTRAAIIGHLAAYGGVTLS